MHAMLEIGQTTADASTGLYVELGVERFSWGDDLE